MSLSDLFSNFRAGAPKMPTSQWQAGMVAPQQQQADPFQQLMSQMLAQRPQQAPQGITGADLQKLIAPVPTHDSAANITGGGSLFNDPNFYQNGQRTGPGSQIQTSVGTYGGGTITRPTSTPSAEMMQSPGFHMPGMSVPQSDGAAGIYANGQSMTPSGAPMNLNPGFTASGTPQAPLQGVPQGHPLDFLNSLIQGQAANATNAQASLMPQPGRGPTVAVNGMTRTY